MRKELLAAIFVGSLLGIAVAFGVWKTNMAFNKPKPNTKPKEEKQEQPKETFEIAIAKPNDFSVSSLSPISVSGVTKKGNWVVISTPETDYFTQTDESGGFKEEIKLISGINDLFFYSFNQEGKSAGKNLTVVLSSAFPEAEDNNRIEQTKNQPIAYIGTVTDITEDTIQIKNGQDEILQIATNKDTVFVNATKATKEVLFKDVAIGDFIIAMGLKNGNKVLEAKRLVITSAPEESKTKVIWAKVTKIDKNTFTANNLEIETDKNTIFSTFDAEGKFTKFSLSKIEEGQALLLAGTQENNTFSARSIHILP